VEDVEPFITWLRGQGLPDEHVAAYRNYLAELAKHPSLSAAIRAAEEAGTPAKQIANMRQVAARFAEFQEKGSVAKPQATPRGTPPAALEVEARTPLAPIANRLKDMEPRRRGCTCKKRYDIYLDNDFGALARWLGGGIGIGTLILIRLIGIFGAAALALGLAGIGGLATVISICFRCEGCRHRITDLDEDERAHLKKGRAMVVLVTAGLLAGSVLCGYLWYLVMKTPPSRGNF
jgi:hypothetical protein